MNTRIGAAVPAVEEKRPLLAGLSKGPPNDNTFSLAIPSFQPVQHLPSSNLPSELEIHHLTLTPGEERLRKAFIILSADAAIWAFNLLYFALSPADQVGMGWDLGTNATIAITSAAGVASIPFAACAMYISYKEWNETLTLISDIIELEAARQKQREDLFLEILRLRCLFEDELEFVTHVRTLNLKEKTLAAIRERRRQENLPHVDNVHEEDYDEVYETQLIVLVNEIYNSPAFQTAPYHLNTDHTLEPAKQTESPAQTQRTLRSTLLNPDQATNEVTRTSIIQQLRTTSPRFERNLHECFKPAVIHPIGRTEPIMYGIVYGSVLFGGLINTVWTVPGILIGAGIAASIPGFGWGLLIAAALVASIYYAKKMYDQRHKNLCRAELKTTLTAQNDSLGESKKQVNNAYTTKKRTPEKPPAPFTPKEEKSKSHEADAAEAERLLRQQSDQAREEAEKYRLEKQKSDERIKTLEEEKRKSDEDKKKSDDRAKALEDEIKLLRSSKSTPASKETELPSNTTRLLSQLHFIATASRASGSGQLILPITSTPVPT